MVHLNKFLIKKYLKRYECIVTCCNYQCIFFNTEQNDKRVFLIFFEQAKLLKFYLAAYSKNKLKVT